MPSRTSSRIRLGLGALALALVAACSSGSTKPTQNVVPPAAPAAPTGVAAIGATTESWITWPAVAGATSYNLYWSTTAGVTKASGARIAGVTSRYRHQGLAVGPTYHYVVTAVNAGGESAISNEATAVPISTSPGSQDVTLSWPASHEAGVNKAGGYYEVSTDGGATYQRINYPYASTAPSPAYVNTTLPSNANGYAGRIRACQRLDASGGTTADSCSALTSFTVYVP